MDKRTDILTDEENDLLIVNGDFAVDISDDQHVQHILLANPGSYKRVPTLGAGITLAQNGAITERMKRNVRQALKIDGYEVKSLRINTDGSLDIVV